jgi:hypothetical protein
MYGEVSNTQDIVSTDDIRDRIDELEEAKDILSDEDYSDEEKEGYEFGEDEERELEMLEDVLKDIGDADYLINENHFEDYARGYVEDCYEGDFNEFPFNCMDWEKVAEEMLVDYTEVSFDGVSYYYR